MTGIHADITDVFSSSSYHSTNRLVVTASVSSSFLLNSQQEITSSRVLIHHGYYMHTIRFWPFVLKHFGDAVNKSSILQVKERLHWRIIKTITNKFVLL